MTDRMACRLLVRGVGYPVPSCVERARLKSVFMDATSETPASGRLEMRNPLSHMALILGVLLLLPAAAFAAECGDVDSNGVVAASDALMVLRTATGQGPALTCDQ